LKGLPLTDKKKDMFNYISALEAVNEQLLFTLSKCVQVMTAFKTSRLIPVGTHIIEV